MFNNSVCIFVYMCMYTRTHACVWMAQHVGSQKTTFRNLVKSSLRQILVPWSRIEAQVSPIWNVWQWRQGPSYGQLCNVQTLGHSEPVTSQPVWVVVPEKAGDRVLVQESGEQGWVNSSIISELTLTPVQGMIIAVLSNSRKNTFSDIQVCERPFHC